MTQIITLTVNPAIDVSTSVSRIVPFNKLRCTPAVRDPGGGGINVARVVTRLGGEAAAIYPSGGATGQLLRRLMDHEGMQSRAITASEETREDFTILEEATGRQYRFILPGPVLAEQEWRSCLNSLASIDSRPSFIVASGSLPPGVPGEFYGSAARIAKELGANAIVDTSGPPLKAALKEGVYLIKPNLREFQELIGAQINDEVAWVEAGRRLIEQGLAQLVALTLGPQGALLIARDRAWRADALPIKPVSVVGAGDSFLGAMVWSLASGSSIDDALRYGVAAGSAALLNPGTELCRSEDVKRLFSQVSVRLV